MRADRLLSILMLLQTRGRITAHELAQRLEVSERTIYRDFEALSRAGIPIYTERAFRLSIKNSVYTPLHSSSVLHNAA